MKGQTQWLEDVNNVEFEDSIMLKNTSISQQGWSNYQAGLSKLNLILFENPQEELPTIVIDLAKTRFGAQTTSWLDLKEIHEEYFQTFSIIQTLDGHEKIYEFKGKAHMNPLWCKQIRKSMKSARRKLIEDLTKQIQNIDTEDNKNNERSRPQKENQILSQRNKDKNIKISSDGWERETNVIEPRKMVSQIQKTQVDFYEKTSADQNQQTQKQEEKREQLFDDVSSEERISKKQQAASTNPSSIASESNIIEDEKKLNQKKQYQISAIGLRESEKILEEQNRYKSDVNPQQSSNILELIGTLIQESESEIDKPAQSETQKQQNPSSFSKKSSFDQEQRQIEVPSPKKSIDLIPPCSNCKDLQEDLRINKDLIVRYEKQIAQLIGWVKKKRQQFNIKNEEVQDFEESIIMIKATDVNGIVMSEQMINHYEIQLDKTPLLEKFKKLLMPVIQQFPLAAQILEQPELEISQDLSNEHSIQSSTSQSSNMQALYSMPKEELIRRVVRQRQRRKEVQRKFKSFKERLSRVYEDQGLRVHPPNSSFSSQSSMSLLDELNEITNFFGDISQVLDETHWSI